MPNTYLFVNYLNRSVKEVTGKPTTALIAERIITEAKALLQQTDWRIADIAYGLGFDLTFLLSAVSYQLSGGNELRIGFPPDV